MSLLSTSSKYCIPYKKQEANTIIVSYFILEDGRSNYLRGVTLKYATFSECMMMC